MWPLRQAAERWKNLNAQETFLKHVIAAVANVKDSPWIINNKDKCFFYYLPADAANKRECVWWLMTRGPCGPCERPFKKRWRGGEHVWSQRDSSSVKTMAAEAGAASGQLVLYASKKNKKHATASCMSGEKQTRFHPAARGQWRMSRHVHVFHPQQQKKMTYQKQLSESLDGYLARPWRQYISPTLAAQVSLDLGFVLRHIEPLTCF